MSKTILTIAITCFSCLLLITSFAVADKPRWAAIPEWVREERELRKAEQEARTLEKKDEEEIRKAEQEAELKANYTDAQEKPTATISSNQAEQEARTLEKKDEEEMRKAEQEAELKANYTDAQEKPTTTIPSNQYGLRDIELLSSIQLDFRLVGVIIAGYEKSYAIIMNEVTGKGGMYQIGDSINEATVLKIDKESILVDKDGMTQVLRVTGGDYTADDPEMEYENFPEFTPYDDDIPPGM